MSIHQCLGFNCGTLTGRCWHMLFISGTASQTSFLPFWESLNGHHQGTRKVSGLKDPSCTMAFPAPEIGNKPENPTKKHTSVVGGWTNPLIKKYASQIGSLNPKDRVENSKTNLWNHHLKNFFLLSFCRIFLMFGYKDQWIQLWIQRGTYHHDPLSLYLPYPKQLGHEFHGFIYVQIVPFLSYQ